MVTLNSKTWSWTYLSLETQICVRGTYDIYTSLSKSCCDKVPVILLPLTHEGLTKVKGLYMHSVMDIFQGN